ncbi:MAG: asparaginase [marine bacterium B5-7]|nr:MAG: asparaginase [marine bacterium B5-7]
MNEKNKHLRYDNPPVIEVWRGSFLECIHRGAAVVVDLAGNILFEVGDVTRPIYARSSLKPLQALAMVESGAATHYRLDGAHLSLACASHNGEKAHVDRVMKWLSAIDADESTLECGAHYPLDQPARDELVCQDLKPQRVHNNCSGKHSGFLTLARYLGIDPVGYIEPNHPLQQEITRTVEETCDYALGDAEPGVDGCGIPVYGIPLFSLANAFAAFSTRANGGDVRAKSRQAIVDGILEYPYLIAGRERFDSRVIEASRGGAIVKTGAEGVFIGTLLDEGIGIALKIDDGATRASEVLMAELLARFSRNPVFVEALDAERNIPIKNAAGLTVGAVRAAALSV